MQIPLRLTHIILIVFVLLVDILLIENVLFIRIYFIFVEEQLHRVLEKSFYLDRN